MPTLSPRTLLLLALLSPPALAGGSPENILLIVDPSSPTSLHIANHYRDRRSIPDTNVVYFTPNPATYTTFPTLQRNALLGLLSNLNISDHIDYIVLSPGIGFYTNAPGIVTDGCSAVTRFAVTTPYTLAQAYTTIPTGISSSLANGYYGGSDPALAFDHSIRWGGGVPVQFGTRYFIGAMLGYDGSLGNTVPEILAMIDRSVAVDGTRPGGTFFFMKTSDAIRSGPRDPFYMAAVNTITGYGLSAQELFQDLPNSGQLCLGVMTGLADPQIDTGNFSLAPGSFCDHLTSYAATFDSSSQTKMSRWIAKGASGTSGTVEEPCNYAGKFPHARLHVYYAQGASLGEAWFRSLAYAPFQQLFTGDPLARPFAYIPVPSLAGVPANPASGTIALVPSATTPHPTASIAGFELLVDGVDIARGTPGTTFALDTTSLTDGWHELRLLAWDDTPVKSTGRSIGAFTVNNHGLSVTFASNPPSGDLGTRFELDTAGLGGTMSRVRIFQGSRVIAAGAGGPFDGRVFGRQLGAGRVRLHAEVQFTNGLVARSAPVDIDIADTDSGGPTVAPAPWSYTKHVRTDAAAVVELPADFSDAVASATWNIVSGPTQATILGGQGPWIAVQPNASASGNDTIAYTVTTSAGTSATGNVTLIYDAPFTCPTPSNYCIGAPNSTGFGATMTWSGSTSVGPNAFALGCYDLPPSTLGLFYYGDSQAQQAFGDGYRCIGSPVIRLGVQPVTIFGDVSRAIDFTQPPFDAGAGAITIGATKNFQFWYRNPAAGGAGFNLSDGLSVTFCP